MSTPDGPRPYVPHPGREERGWDGSGNGRSRSAGGYRAAGGYRYGDGRAGEYGNGDGRAPGGGRGAGRAAGGRGRHGDRGYGARSYDGGGYDGGGTGRFWQRRGSRGSRAGRRADDGWESEGRTGRAAMRSDWGATALHERVQARTGGRYRGDGRLRGLTEQLPAGRRGRDGGGPGGYGPPGGSGGWWRHWTWRKALALAGVGAGAAAVVAAAGIGIAYAKTPIPRPEASALQQASSVYFSGGKTLVGRFGSTNRVDLTIRQIPKVLQDAVVAAEDKNFYHEGGISPTGILRALYYDLTRSGGNLQGGSTITQQLVRNYYDNIGTAQTITRKIKEIFVAQKLAQVQSKQWILEQYLNTVYFGSGAYGVAAAADTYFGLQPSQLSQITPSQAAMIAAMIQSPSYYSPHPKAGAAYQALVFRWHYVLSTMQAMGTLSARQAAQAKFPAVIKPVNNSWSGYRGYIMDAVRNELQNTYHISLARINNGGLRIVTTFSQRLMNALNKAVSYNENLMRHDAPPGGSVAACPPQGCLPKYVHVGAVLENPKNGAIEAMYPGPPYGPDHTYNYALVSRNQVGSSFKPYVLATAVKLGMSVQTSKLNGYSPLWIPPDSQPYTLASLHKPAAAGSWYQVQNDEVSNPNHPVSVVTATSLSLNTAYTDLWHRVAYNPQTGAHPVTDMAKAFGVNVGPYPNGSGMTGAHAMQDQAGIALGQASLTVEEQATMIATLANGGTYHTPHVIQSFTVPDPATGTAVLHKAVIQHHQVLTPEQAADVDYAMSFDTTPQGTAAGMGLTNGQTIIAKTGTTNLSQQAFFLGATPMDAMAVGMFVDKGGCNVPASQQYLCSASSALKYNPNIPGLQTLFGVGGLAGYGGQWPALIWHTFFMNEFNSLPVQPWPPVNNWGTAWNLAIQLPKPKPKPVPSHVPIPGPGCNGNGRHCRGLPTPTPGLPTPNPTPTPTGCGLLGCPSSSSSPSPGNKPTKSPVPPGG